MKNRNIIIISASIVLVSILCCVQGEHKKRDVHRIIIQDRIPRPRHHVHDHDPHNHGKRSGFRTGKKGPRPSISAEDMSKSFEDSGSYSMESHEKSEKFINSKLKQFKKPPRSPYNSNHETTEPDAIYAHSNTKHTINSDWIPLDTDPVAQHLKFSQTNSRYRKPNSIRNNIPSNIPNNIPNNIPIATYTENPNVPVIQYEAAGIYPITLFSEDQNNFHNLHYFNNPNVKQNTIDLTQLSVMPSMHQVDANMMVAPNVPNNDDRLKNHRLSYAGFEDESGETVDDMMASENKSVNQSDEKRNSKRDRRNKPHGGSKRNERDHRHGRSSSSNKGKTRHH